MIAYFKKLTVRNIVSPYGLALVSYSIFLFAWLFPPRLYTEYIHEPDLMFLDPLTFVFYTSCVAAFLLGVRFTGLWHVRSPEPSLTNISMEAPVIYLIAPVLVLTVPCAILMVLSGAKLNSLALLASQQGQSIKAAAETVMAAPVWAKYQTFQTAILWWAVYRAGQIKLSGFSRTVFYTAFLVGVVVNVLTCLVTVDRTDLIPLVAGLLVVYLYNKTQTKNVSLRRLALSGTASALTLLGGFFALSFLRGALVVRLLVVSLMGYTIVSYNRLAAVLSGLMRYTYGGYGVYLAQILDQVEKIDTLRKYLNWPSANVVWQAEFTSTYMAGLNSSYIWASVFGYVYSDIGWWTLLYLFGAGILAGVFWARFVAGKTSGLVFYPWIAFCILFWIGWNMLLDTRAFRLLEILVPLWMYDRYFFRRSPRMQQSGPLNPGNRILQPVAAAQPIGLL